MTEPNSLICLFVFSSTFGLVWHSLACLFFLLLVRRGPNWACYLRLILRMVWLCYAMPSQVKFRSIARFNTIDLLSVLIATTGRYTTYCKLKN
ncbi:hypothetical protein BDV95DRAFT_586622 [Massariosphaeria phaeospora]|uniref:Uncharacterized protein n=1 Tax=Massariosphaeria phaeospora TaxID=100035 RepID=A0A7C8M1T1_9PLEO|nr:hypothetical protein BDV95DRAFT_586622 [Massariosphaeria phaeospora]